MIQIKNLIILTISILALAKSFNAFSDDVHDNENAFIKLDDDSKPIRLTNEHSLDVKIHVGRFTTECFHEYLKAGEVFHLIYHVLKGGSLKVIASISDPNNKMLHLELSSTYYWYSNDNVTLEGAYKICFTNKEIEAKVVYVNIITYHPQEIKKKQEELVELEVSKDTLKASFDNITANVHYIHIHQVRSKVQSTFDQWLAESNNEYVMYYSIFQVFITFIAGFIQVFFIKKLFKAGPSKNFPQKA